MSGQQEQAKDWARLWEEEERREIHSGMAGPTMWTLEPEAVTQTGMVSPKAAAAERHTFAASPRAAHVGAGESGAGAGGSAGLAGAVAGTPTALPTPLAATTDKFPDA